MRTLIRNTRLRFITIAIAASALLAGAGVSIAQAASTPTQQVSCVTFGKAGSVVGNFMLYDWNRSACPAGTYTVKLGQSGAPTLVAPDVDPKPAVVTKTFTPTAAIKTGGGFVANATDLGTVTLPAGKWLVSVQAKATPPSAGTGAVNVFPQFFVYNQAANATFTGDLFNVGSGALESGSHGTIDSYYSGSSVVTVTAATDLHVLAFGYDSDQSAGTYTLDGLTITAIQIS